MKEQTVRPIISNIRTTTYETAKFLKTLLTPLTKSQYNVLSTDDFIQKVRNERIPKGFKMITFDVKSVFTNVPLHQTVEIICRKFTRKRKLKHQFLKTFLENFCIYAQKKFTLCLMTRFTSKATEFQWVLL